MEDLPAECWVHVACYLDVRAVAALRETSRRLSRIAADRVLWRRLCYRDGMVLAKQDPVLAAPQALVLDASSASTSTSSSSSTSSSVSLAASSSRGGEDAMDVVETGRTTTAARTAAAAAQAQDDGDAEAMDVSTGEADWWALYREQYTVDRAWRTCRAPARAPERVRGLPVSSIAVDVAHTPQRLFLGMAHGRVLVHPLVPPNQDRGNAAVVTEHAGSVSHMLVAGDTLFTASFDGSVRLFALDQGKLLVPQTGELRSPGAHAGDMTAIAAVGVSGDLVVTGRMDGTLAVWSRKAAGVIQSIAAAHDGWLPCLDAHGDRVVTGGQDGLVKIWRWEAAAAPHDGAARSAAASAPGRSWTAPDAAVRLVLQQTLKGHRNTVVGMQVRGDILATASYDRTVGVWNLSTGQLLHRLEGHHDHVNAVAFTPRWHLVTCSEDGATWLWNWRTGELVQTLSDATGSSVDCLALAEPYMFTGCVDGFLAEYYFAPLPSVPAQS